MLVPLIVGLEKFQRLVAIPITACAIDEGVVAGVYLALQLLVLCNCVIKLAVDHRETILSLFKAIL